MTLTGGLAPYNYLWYSSPYQTVDTAINLAAGNYRVRVIDTFGCTIFDSVTIQNNYSSQVSTTTTIGNCDSMGSASAIITTGSPPYTYLWNTHPADTTATIRNVLVGNYQVSVTDASGCTRTGSVNIQFSCIGLVTGTVFYDANANCIIDNGEQGIAGVPVAVTNNNVTFEGTTNLSGDYSIQVTAPGTYKIITGVSESSAILQYGNSACGYLEACPSNDVITFATLNDTFQHYNFGFVGSSDFDLAINAGWGPVDANHLKEYWALYTNEAFIQPYTNTATITFNYDSNLIFQSGIPTPVNDAAAHTLTWTVDSIPSPTFVWTKRVRAFFTVPTDLPVDYPLKNDFHIEPYAGDCDTGNNSIYTEQIAGLPDKPISKEVVPHGDLGSADSVLTYTIFFQNRGPDIATVIKVTDTLSFYLDPSSVQNIASSPLYNQFYIAAGAVLTWVFNPIDLPSSQVDSLNSAGFISFTAKLRPGTPRGYYIKNHAAIAINNNVPVVTNTTSSYLSFPVSITEVEENAVGVKVFPNPFDNVTNIVVEGFNGKYDFELTDMTGRVVEKVGSILGNRFQVNRDGLAAGVYSFRLTGNGKTIAWGKLVVQ